MIIQELQFKQINDVYLWGELLGISLAGQNGNKNGSIASLCMNPLQLSICEIVAIGPKEKLKHKYPELAILDAQKITIKTYMKK